MKKDYNKILKENFNKIAKWIKETFPHAIEQSFKRDIECNSKHHTYHSSYIVLSKGDVQYHRGSHGWNYNDSIYSYEQQKWNNDGTTDLALEEFIHEWSEQKLYVSNSLQPFENMYNFKV